jgi:hypothetical protein
VVKVTIAQYTDLGILVKPDALPSTTYSTEPNTVDSVNTAYKNTRIF